MEKSKHYCCLLLNHSTYQLKKVRIIGVEPTWIAPPDPKSGASANFAISGNYFLFPAILLSSFLLLINIHHIWLRGAKVRDLYKILKQKCFFVNSF